MKRTENERLCFSFSVTFESVEKFGVLLTLLEIGEGRRKKERNDFSIIFFGE